MMARDKSRALFCKKVFDKSKQLWYNEFIKDKRRLLIMYVTVKDVENRCYELARKFNETCDPKDYFMFLDERDFYSDIYKDEYGIRPHGFHYEVFDSVVLNPKARDVANKINALDWKEFEKQREELLGSY